MGRARPGGPTAGLGERVGEGGGGVCDTRAAADRGRGAGDFETLYGAGDALPPWGVMGRMDEAGECERGRERGSGFGLLANVSAVGVALAGAVPVGVLIVR